MNWNDPTEVFERVCSGRSLAWIECRATLACFKRHKNDPIATGVELGVHQNTVLAIIKNEGAGRARLHKMLTWKPTDAKLENKTTLPPPRTPKGKAIKVATAAQEQPEESGPRS